MPDTKADKLGTEVVHTLLVENYSLLATCNSSMDQDTLNLLILYVCHALIFLPHTDNL